MLNFVVDLDGRLYNVHADQAATCISSLLYAEFVSIIRPLAAY